jgi:hypothetical protein
MDDDFKIYVDQLRNGHDKTIAEKLSPDFLEINERDLVFEKNVTLDGKAYLADQELILHWDIHAEALIACTICNAKVPVDIEIENFYHAEPLSEIKGAVFNFKELLRSTILLEVPSFAECNHGNCPKRKEIVKYLKEKPELPSDEEGNEGYRPFADLDLK